jgi:hypothetical protein
MKQPAVPKYNKNTVTQTLLNANVAALSLNNCANLLKAINSKLNNANTTSENKQKLRNKRASVNNTTQAPASNNTTQAPSSNNTTQTPSSNNTTQAPARNLNANLKFELNKTTNNKLKSNIKNNAQANALANRVRNAARAAGKNINTNTNVKNALARINAHKVNLTKN